MTGSARSARRVSLSLSNISLHLPIPHRGIVSSEPVPKTFQVFGVQFTYLLAQLLNAAHVASFLGYIQSARQLASTLN